jgi:uncharacterized membrane protein (DUF485 family)
VLSIRSNFRGLAFLATLSFLAVFFLSPLLHDHEHDFCDHPACPACIVWGTPSDVAPAFFLFVFFTVITVIAALRLPSRSFLIAERETARGPPSTCSSL